MSNPELLAAQQAIPGYAELEARLAALKDAESVARSAGASPDEARAAVISEAVEAVAGGAKVPEDVGTRAAKAYLSALEANAAVQVVIGARRAVEDRLQLLRECSGIPAALAALDGRLSEVLTEARGVLASLDGITLDAESAVDAGKGAEFAQLRVLLRTLTNIRMAQTTITTRDSTIGGGPASLLRKPIAHARNVVAADVPGEAMPVISRLAEANVSYLTWLLTVDAWVPAPDDLLDAHETAKAMEVGEVLHPDYYTPRELAVRPVSAPPADEFSPSEQAARARVLARQRYESR